MSSTTITKKISKTQVQENEKSPQMIDVTTLTPEHAVERLIAHAVEMDASDIFIVSNEQHVAVLARHLGVVRPISVMDNEQGKRCLSHIKANSGMDLSEKRRPGDGRWIFERGGIDGAVDIRINVIPTMYGEDVAMRLLA